MKGVLEETVSPLGDDITSHRARKAERNPKYRAAVEKYRISHEVAKRLIAYRIEHQLTQQQLAERLGTAHSVISRLERGDHPANLDTLTRVGSVLGFGIALVDRKPQPIPAKLRVEDRFRGGNHEKAKRRPLAPQARNRRTAS